jgi:anti-sigma B factor antagonist
MFSKRTTNDNEPLTREDENLFSFHGRLDAAVIRNQKKQMLDILTRTEGDIVLSMAAVPFVDSTGLGFLVAVHKELAQRGDRLLLCEPVKQLRVLLELTRLHQVFTIFDSADQARRTSS